MKGKCLLILTPEMTLYSKQIHKIRSNSVKETLTESINYIATQKSCCTKNCCNFSIEWISTATTILGMMIYGSISLSIEQYIKTFSNYSSLVSWIMEAWRYFQPICLVFPFYTPWKHQKTAENPRFSDVFRVHKKGILGSNVLTLINIEKYK